MGRMPSTAGGLTATTLRLSNQQAAWLAKEAKTAGNANEVVREMFDDAMTMFGLPPPVVDRLQQDAESKGLRLSSYPERKEYLQRILMLRYDALVRGESPKLGTALSKAGKK